MEGSYKSMIQSHKCMEVFKGFQQKHKSIEKILENKGGELRDNPGSLRCTHKKQKRT